MNTPSESWEDFLSSLADEDKPLDVIDNQDALTLASHELDLVKLLAMCERKNAESHKAFSEAVRHHDLVGQLAEQYYQEAIAGYREGLRHALGLIRSLTEGGEVPHTAWTLGPAQRETLRQRAARDIARINDEVLQRHAKVSAILTQDN